MWLSVVLARIGVLCGLGLALFITRDLLAPAPQLPCDFILLGSVSSNGATILVKGCEEGVETAVLKLFRDKSSPSPALIAEAQPDIRIANDDGKMWFGSCEFLRLEANTTYRVEYHRKQISFKTFPTSSSEPLRISFGSCSSLTSFPWNSLSSAFTKILDLHPTLALFLGDNVYTDVHETLPWYRIPFDTAYLRLLADPAVVKLRQTVPTYTMFDDHEVENDFQGLQHPLATKGLEAYVKFMGQTNPGRSLNISKLYYSFDYATTASFFVVDTRLNYNPEKGLLLGTAQKDELLSWLRRGAKLGFDHLIIVRYLIDIRERKVKMTNQYAQWRRAHCLGVPTATETLSIGIEKRCLTRSGDSTYVT